MISVLDVSHFRTSVKGLSPILWRASVAIAARDRVGILAPAGAGKTTLARLFSGIEKPDSGDILIEGRTSWPLGFAGFLHPNLTVLQNMHTIAGLVGIPQRDLADFCAWFCDMPGLLARMTRDLSPTERASIAYACALAIPCDHLVADDTIVVGDKRQRQKCEDLLDARLCDAGLVFLSKNASQLKQYCDRTFVLIGGRLSPCSDLDAAQDALEAFANNSREKEHADG